MRRIAKVLIANRGEIAVRVIRACRELGIATVAVFSDADREARHVLMANQAYHIGGSLPRESYLNVARLLEVAQISGADALHPGYGFLSENAGFAQACIDAGLTWIGPNPRAIALMGDKSMAKQTVAAAGVPLVPGTQDPLPGLEDARALAEEIGYPVLLKALAGGGGRGMRVVAGAADMPVAWNSAAHEAAAAFGDGRLYLERYLRDVRHIEFQILADQHGHVIHLGERECSVQRRHQKLIEEAPSTALTLALRKRMGEAAVAAAQACGYDSAGTIEFLLAGDGHFYFLEMNTRLQVEHAVTEAVTGIDLVKAQIFSAAGKSLQIEQSEVQLRGHAIECRITAEDSTQNFVPTTGTIEAFVEPGGPGVRVDSGLTAHATISPYYDSLIAKVIASADTRPDAIARMRRALEEMRVIGIATSIPFHLFALQDQAFIRGNYDLSFVDSYRPAKTVAEGDNAQHQAEQDEALSDGLAIAMIVAALEQSRTGQKPGRINNHNRQDQANQDRREREVERTVTGLTELSAWQRSVRESS